MNIKFSWGTGWMEMNADYVIETMPMRNYRKWAKLFAQYGEPQQHTAFLQLVDTYIVNQICTSSKTKRYKTIRQVLEGLVS